MHDCITRRHASVELYLQLRFNTHTGEHKPTPSKPKFHVGQIVATPGALRALEDAGVPPVELLGRHVHGDWGDLDDEDKQTNEDALQHGGRIFSAYVLTLTQTKIWVITEADRSSTCLLLPEEY